MSEATAIKTPEQAGREPAPTPSRRREDTVLISVLVVSPNERLRSVLRDRLPPPRWLVSEVFTGAEALEHLERQSSDVLLLDPMLGDLEPVEFSGIVGSEFPGVQILTLNSQTGQLLLGVASPTAIAAQLSELLYRDLLRSSASSAPALWTGLASPPHSGACSATSPQSLTQGGDLRAPSMQDLAQNMNSDAGSEVHPEIPDTQLGVAASAHRWQSRELEPRPPIDPQSEPGRFATRAGFSSPQTTDGVVSSTYAASRSRTGIRGMVGDSEAMQRIYELVHMVSGRDTTVVVTGESGTGKDLIAQALHLLSPRSRQPLIVINCAAIPEPLLEAELFGYVKGSFTGATQSRIGRIHAAHGGTLFLDEIGDMPLALQSKILRFLEQGEVQRLGGNDNLKVDVRVVAATNADLKGAVERRLFREDLYYRLMVFPIHLPPLRDRGSDLGRLAEAFLLRFSPGSVLSPGALARLEAHGWAGNVRELRNVIERATILGDDQREIGPEHIVL
ncbi:MAG TPA: sigma-54-dependent Fis family transcriptional regulator [Acidisarcina sp.]